MVRKFPPFRSERKKRSTSEGTPQFPNGISGKLPYHLTSNRNFRIFWPNGKHPVFLYKALYGYIEIDISFIKSVSHGHSRRSQSSDIRYLETPFCKTATYQSSFFSRSLQLWNLICKLIRPCDFLKIKTFKNSITNFLKMNYLMSLTPTNHAHGVLHVIVHATGNNSLYAFLIIFGFINWVDNVNWPP